jgi:hypothetical protein
MKPGDRIYYTGDMANGSSYGTITAVNEPTKYTQKSVDISYDEERFEGDTKTSRMVPVLCFAPGSGRRFWVAEEYDREQKERMDAMLARMRKVTP